MIDAAGAAAAHRALESLGRRRVPGAPPAGAVDSSRLLATVEAADVIAEAGYPIAFPREFGREAPWAVLREGERGFRLRFPVSPPRDAVALGQVVAEEGAAAEASGVPLVLGLDYSARGLSEVQLANALYGEATYFHPPARPPAPGSPLVRDAVLRGFREALQLHNLLPQNRLVVLEEDHGIFPRMPEARAVAGAFARFPGGGYRFFPNPFSPDARPDLLRRFAEDTRMGCI